MKMEDKKSIQKCVRMTQAIFDFVDKQKGNGFNQKFENLVFRYQKEEKEKTKILEQLNKEIAEKMQIIKELDSEIGKKRSLVNNLLDSFKCSLDNTIERMNNL